MSSSSSGNDVLLNQLADEFIQRYRQGERPSLSEYVERYPDLASDIREVLPALVEMEQVEIDPGSIDPVSPDCNVLPEKIGDFRVLSRIGQGGMGVVYEAEQLSLGRHVALKVIEEQKLARNKLVRRFRREAKAIARLHHTNIVPIFFVGEEGGLPYYAMQLIRGLGLDQVLEELQRRGEQNPSDHAPHSGRPQQSANENVSVVELAHSLMTGEFRKVVSNESDGSESDPELDATTATFRDDINSTPTEKNDSHPDRQSLSSTTLLANQTDARANADQRTYWETVSSMGEQIAEGLAYAHSQGVLHRDIKPSNLLLDMGGTVWITDFGLAKLTDEQDLTGKEDILGTLRYMPPEAFNGKSDERSDVYSLGLTLYELLALRPAFDANEHAELFRQVTIEDPVRLRRLNREIPRDLETIVHKAIERQPDRRYQSAGEMAEDLRRFLADEPIQVSNPSPLERLVRWSRRNKAVASWMAVAALLLVLGTGVSSYFAIQEGIRAKREKNARLTAVNARNKALRDREEKDTALKKAEEARNKEVKERKAKEVALQEKSEALQLSHQSEKKALWNLYVARLFPMKAAWKARDFGQLEYLLEQSVPKEGEPDFRGWEWYYLLDQCRQISHKLGGSSDRLGPSDWCQKTGRIAIVEESQTIVIYDRSGKRMKSLSKKGPRFRRLVWSPDGTMLAGAQGPLLRIWEIESGTLLQEWSVANTEHGRMWELAWSRDGEMLAAAVTPSTGTIKLYETEKWTLAGTLNLKPKHSSKVYYLSWHRDNVRLTASYGDSTYITWDAKAGKQLTGVLRNPGSESLAVSWSPDGKQLATGNSRGLTIWDERGKKLRYYPCDLSDGAISWSPDGKWLAAGGKGQILLLWNLKTAKPHESSCHGAVIRNVSWNAESTRILVSGGGSARVVRPELDESTTQLFTTGSESEGRRVCWSPDGKRICCSHSQGLSFFDATTGKHIQTLAGINADPYTWPTANTLFCSVRSAYALTELDTSASGEIKVKRTLNLKDGSKTDNSSMTTPLVYRNGGYSVPYNTSHIILFRPSRRAQVIRVKGYLRRCALSPDFRFLAIGTKTGGMTVWDVANSRVCSKRNAWWILDIVWSPDGKFIAVAQQNGEIQIVRGEDGKLIHQRHAHKGGVKAIAWAGNGRRIVTVGANNTMAIWDAATGDKVFTIPCDKSVVDVSWSPDSRHLGCLCKDGSLHVWGSSDIGSLSERVTHLESGVLAATKTVKEELVEEEARLTAEIKSTPEDVQGLKARGDFYLQTQRWKLAAQDYERVLDLQQQPERVVLEKALLANRMSNNVERYEAHRNSFLNVILTKPDLPGWVWRNGARYCTLLPGELDLFPDLLKGAESYARQYPDKWWNVLATASVTYRLGMYQKALPMLLKAQELATNSGSQGVIHLWLALVYHQLEKPELAKAQLKAAVKLQPLILPQQEEKISLRQIRLVVEYLAMRQEAEAAILGRKAQTKQQKTP